MPICYLPHPFQHGFHHSTQGPFLTEGMCTNIDQTERDRVGYDEPEISSNMRHDSRGGGGAGRDVGGRTAPGASSRESRLEQVSIRYDDMDVIGRLRWEPAADSNAGAVAGGSYSIEIGRNKTERFYRK